MYNNFDIIRDQIPPEMKDLFTTPEDEFDPNIVYSKYPNYYWMADDIYTTLYDIDVMLRNHERMIINYPLFIINCAHLLCDSHIKLSNSIFWMENKPDNSKRPEGMIYSIFSEFQYIEDSRKQKTYELFKNTLLKYLPHTDKLYNEILSNY